jgi:hypothetical protein
MAHLCEDQYMARRPIEVFFYGLFMDIGLLRSQEVLSCWRASKAGGYAAFLSTVITRGRMVWLARSTFRKNCSAAPASRVALHIKSSVAPAESTAR